MTHPDESKFKTTAFSGSKVDQLKKILQGQEERGEKGGSSRDHSLTASGEAKVDLGEDNSMPGALKEIAGIKDKLDQAEDELEALKAKLEAAEKEKNDAHLRSLAEVENVRRRIGREKEDFMRYGSEPLLRELLNTVDNLERIIAHLAPGEVAEGVRDGMELVLKQLLATLTQFGVKPVEAANKPFDPNVHETIAERAVAGVPSHQVVEVHQQGYRHHDRLLRPARVTIAS